MSAKTKSIILTPIGLFLLSIGLAVLTEAANQRRIGVDFQVWFLLGIYSMALINIGLIGLGMALRFRILSDVRRETRRSIRQSELKLNARKPQNPRKSKGGHKAKSPTKTD
ncbi:alkaline shock response membrane anchor protein AmaP [Dyadobacter jejuensis]|nr:alkaline shock response membrane anchor protein AmaP [Dyadobacter jejuensis]